MRGRAVVAWRAVNGAPYIYDFGGFWMEYIYLAAGVCTAFFCMLFYRKGVKDGLGLKEGRITPIAEKPAVLMTKEEKRSAAEEKKIADMAHERELQLNELLNYQPKYTAKRGE